MADDVTPTTETEPAAPSTADAVRPGRRTVSEVDRRTVMLAGALLFGAIIAGIVAFAALADPGTPEPAANAGQSAPHIVVKPNSGQAPKDGGDRGGWEQLTLLGLVIVSVTGIGFVALRGGGEKARANREAWKAAGASGRDGAVG